MLSACYNATDSVKYVMFSDKKDCEKFQGETH